MFVSQIIKSLDQMYVPYFQQAHQVGDDYGAAEIVADSASAAGSAAATGSRWIVGGDCASSADALAWTRWRHDENHAARTHLLQPAEVIQLKTFLSFLNKATNTKFEYQEELFSTLPGCPDLQLGFSCGLQLQVFQNAMHFVGDLLQSNLALNLNRLE